MVAISANIISAFYIYIARSTLSMSSSDSDAYSNASTDSDDGPIFLCLGCKDSFPLQDGWAISCAGCGCGYYCIPCMNAINNNQRRCVIPWCNN